MGTTFTLELFFFTVTKPFAATHRYKSVSISSPNPQPKIRDVPHTLYNGWY